MRFLTVVALLLFFIPESASAFCFDEAGEMYHVDPRLLWAIAKHESDFKPGAVNRNSDGSVDVGLMQINSWWVKEKKISHELWSSLGEPCINVKNRSVDTVTVYSSARLHLEGCRMLQRSN